MTLPSALADDLALPAYVRRRLRTYIEAREKAAYDAGVETGRKLGERDALARLPREDRRIEAIKRAVAAAFNIDVAELTSRRRYRIFARPRQVAMFLACEATDHPMTVIGRLFGRDHTTVIHANERVRELLDADPAFAALVAEARTRLAADPAQGVLRLVAA